MNIKLNVRLIHFSFSFFCYGKIFYTALRIHKLASSANCVGLEKSSFTLNFLTSSQLISRVGGSAEVRAPLPQLHLQGQGRPARPLPAGPLPGHGGRHGPGGRPVPGVHRVGQGGEEDLPQTGTGGQLGFFLCLSPRVKRTGSS